MDLVVPILMRGGTVVIGGTTGFDGDGARVLRTMPSSESRSSRSTRRCGAASILAHCRRNLAGYKRPRHILCVEDLPRTTVNKVSKPALRARFAGSTVLPQPC